MAKAASIKVCCLLRTVGVSEQAWVIIIIRKCKLVFDLVRGVLEGRAVGGGDVTDLVGRGGRGGRRKAAKSGHDVTSYPGHHGHWVYILEKDTVMLSDEKDVNSVTIC